jgi:hypothetical protein
MWLVESQQTLDACFAAGFLFGLFLKPEDVGEMFLQNFGRLSTDYTALYSKVQNSL